jgi:hypothetical protein
VKTHATVISRSLKECSSSLQTLGQKPTRAQHAVSVRGRSVGTGDGYGSLTGAHPDLAGSSASAATGHEPASGRRRRRPAPARLAEAKAGQVGICGGRTGLDICSGCRDPSIPPLQVSTARSASFVLGVSHGCVSAIRSTVRTIHSTSRPKGVEKVAFMGNICVTKVGWGCLIVYYIRLLQ